MSAPSPLIMNSIPRRRLLITGAAGGLGLAVADGLAGPAVPASAEPVAYDITVDPQQRHQQLDGFGASGAWWAQKLGRWSLPNRRRIADLLFSRDTGIGLSQYRYNLGGGTDDTITDPWRTAESFDDGPGRYDWTRDAAARWFLQAARSRGVKDLVAFVNSPIRRLTRNGHTYGNPGAGSNLAPENYAAFAGYLTDVLRHFRDADGIVFNELSPINEPQWGWDAPGQEGCHYEPDEAAAVVRAVLRAVRGTDLDTAVLAPEAGEYKSVYSEQSYADVLLADPELSAGLSLFAVHSYWSTDDQRQQAAEHLQQYPRQRLWMTEWCQMVGGRDLGMDSALTLARTVHADLTIAGASAWQLWVAVSPGDYHDGVIYTDFRSEGDPESIIETKRLWALGNYSRFLRPGAIRVDSRLDVPDRTDGVPARIPFVTPDIATDTSVGETIFRIDDPAGDDTGPGGYVYPRNNVFVPGCFDLRRVEAIDAGDDVAFAITIGDGLTDPWGGSPVGYDLQIFDIYVDRSGDGSGFTDLLPGRRAQVASPFAWDRAVFVTGRTDVAEQDVADKVPAAMRDALFVPLTDRQSIDGNTLTVRVPKSFLGEPQPGWSYQVLVLGSEGNMAADSLRAREVNADVSDWNFGGGSDGTEDPNIIDLLVPTGTTQAEALAWTPATVVRTHVSAFVHPHDQKLIMVAINEAPTPQPATLTIRHPGKRLTLRPYRTAGDDDLRALHPVDLTSDGSGSVAATVTLGPRSVTTFVGSYPV